MGAQHQSDVNAAPSKLSPLEWLLLRATRTRTLTVWKRYLLATLFVFGAFGLRLALFGPGSGYPYLLFFPAVVASAALLDRGSGCYAAALSMGLAALSIGPSFGLPAAVKAEDFIAALLYLGLALLSAYLVEELHALLELTLEQKRNLARKVGQQALALDETAHRTQNDLHILAWTVSRQAKGVDDPAVRAALREAEGRIRAFSRLNQRLAASGQSKPGSVDSAEFLTGLVTDIRQGAVGLRPITIEVKAESHALLLTRAVSLGVIVNELVTNTLKYAFPDDQAGTLTIEFHRDGNGFALAVIDDGVGISMTAVPQGTGLGRQIVRSVVAQIGGTVEIGAREHSRGTSCVVRFPGQT